MKNVQGYFLETEPGCYRIEGLEAMEPFFLTLAGDEDLWAFVSTNGSLAAGRKDSEGAFFPYETVDKIHARWDSVGPRTWVRLHLPDGAVRLWEPFAASAQLKPPSRSVVKDDLGSLLTLEETDPVTGASFLYTWSFSRFGLVRRVRFSPGPVQARAEILDGLVGLIPPGVTNRLQSEFSSLTDAYKWNESHEDGRLALFTLYSQITDRAEPKESLHSLAVWSVGDRADKVLLSRDQLASYVQGREVSSETLTRGRPGCFLELRKLKGDAPASWFQVVEAPLTQSQTKELARKISTGELTAAVLDRAMQENRDELAKLLEMADFHQSGPDPMAAAHHASNVLFNVQRGGVFPDGVTLRTKDFHAFVQKWNRIVAARHEAFLSSLSEFLRRSDLEKMIVERSDAQLERLFREYLPLTFSRRHGDPSRPWNKFSIRVRDEQGKRLLEYQGNWRDIFQNWEALAWSWPEYLDGFLVKFLSAMTRDGYNPYRIGRNGVDWEVPEPGNPWSNIGYWGDHQLIYLLKFLELADRIRPTLLKELWNRPIFASADVPYRLSNFAGMYEQPQKTIAFSQTLQNEVLQRVARLGSDGRLVPDSSGQPYLTTMAEKLLATVLVKSANLIPGCGLWLNTQRPEWNDANNALVGYGVSVVSLAYLRRFLVFFPELALNCEDFELRKETADFLAAQTTILERAGKETSTDPFLRHSFVRDMGLAAEAWREAVYKDGVGETVLRSGSSIVRFAEQALRVVETSLELSRRQDGLWHSYNFVGLEKDRVDLTGLYPMLEGQVALLSSGFLDSGEALKLVRTLQSSPLFDKAKNTFLLYPDRELPGFWEKNRIDDETVRLELVRKSISEKRRDLFQQDPDGVIRFAADLSNREDLEAVLKKLAQDPEWYDVVSREGEALVSRYEAIFHHREFTGRSGTMFGYEGLGCVYWHMVSKLLLAVQENFWKSWDEKGDWKSWRKVYHEVRNGLGYRKSPQDYGAFPFDPYSHTPSIGGAQQPGMTGQVKEEILTRWGELGLRWKKGNLSIEPVLLDGEEARGSIRFRYRRTAFILTPGNDPALELVAPDLLRRSSQLTLKGDDLRWFDEGRWKEIRVTWVPA